MKSLLAFFLCFQIALLGSFFEEEDPMLYHHVNVISGQINLCFTDGIVKAPNPFSIVRTYTSSGALERDYWDTDLEFENLRQSAWMLYGGWSLLPRTQIFVQRDYDCSCIERSTTTIKTEGPDTPEFCYIFHVQENSGQYLTYRCSKKIGDEGERFSPQNFKDCASGNLSPRQNLRNSYFELKGKQTILHLPDGGKRYYSKKNKYPSTESFWTLDLEILPNQHQVVYFYESKYSPKLTRIELKNPSGTKTFTTIHFKEENEHLQVQLPGVPISYHLFEHKERKYLEKVSNQYHNNELFYYEPGRKSTGARINAVEFEGSTKFFAKYYYPKTIKKEKEYSKRKRKKIPLEIDKVQYLQFSNPENDSLFNFAEFVYKKNLTEIKDYEGVLTRYHHDGEKLLSIEYFDNKNALHSTTQFDWDNEGRLVAKKLIDPNGILLFSKSFFYDEKGNIVEEKWEDQTKNLCFHRKLTYSKSYLVVREEEVGGLTYFYEYLGQTDLLTKKLTMQNDQILLREFWNYDEDDLPTSKIIDDGNTPSFENLSGVTERTIERFTNDPNTGLRSSLAESYLDLSTQKEHLFRTIHYTYNEKREIIGEILVYGPQNKSHTLHFEYDSHGHLTQKTTPLGKVQSYTYDTQGNLLTIKEVGSPPKTFSYDAFSRVKECKEPSKITCNSYDAKGRLYQLTDGRENPTFQSFDCFGRCIETKLSQTFDQNGNPYFPIICSTYDLLGNLTSYQNSKEETTLITYNGMRKPVHTTYPDGSIESNEYNHNGTLAKILCADQTQIVYAYDPFQRMTSKKILSSSGDLLSEEKWSYSSFHLLSYTNPLGLITTYEYDLFGRKIAERQENRLTTYAYDDFGFLKKVSTEGYTKVQIHNCEGEIIEQWEEDSLGKRENYMQFFYDEEGRKEKAIRITSQGEAEDHFHYDEEGKLTCHIDPLGNVTQFIYNIIKNSLEQSVERKITIDPLGNRIIEIYDVGGHISQIEKQDPQNQIVAKEEYFYDAAGNQARRIVTIYENNSPLRTHTTCWEYNAKGLVTKETEANQKETIYEYDIMGRLIRKTLPSKTTLTYDYNPLGRLLEIKSSDQTIHYTYCYQAGSQPIEAKDMIRNETWNRTYNLFEEITSEIRPDGQKIEWSYDNRGRCTLLTLPDQSSIAYTYTDLHLHAVSRYNPEGELKYTQTYTVFDENGHVFQEEFIHDLGTVTTTHDLLERVHTTHTPWHSASIEYGPSNLVTKTMNTLFEEKDYQYDPLNQLVKEKDDTYSFDSLGNPLDAEINSLNQVLSTSLYKFTYNPNGHPIRQIKNDQETVYTYDALDRLTTINTISQRYIEYQYDPFSRLYRKSISPDETYSFFGYNRTPRTITYYLYNQEEEIGTLDTQKNIRQLKVNGLGLFGEIGAAIAIEIDSQSYAPIHDFTGNIIALVAKQGNLLEACDFDAFGKKALSRSSINPWRFQSKRSEEHLVFFGKRFYNPQLGRWQTPDPAGSFESPNLYLYVLNSPLNRLDLFGLYSDAFRTVVPISDLQNKSDRFIYAKAFYHEIESDWILASNQFHKLQFTPEELNTGKIDILEHFHELFNSDGFGVSLTTYKNGIKNELEDLKEPTKYISSRAPEDGLFIALHTPTHGIVEDIGDTKKEQSRAKETPETILTRQTLIALSETLAKVSPQLLINFITHSRAGATSCAAIDGMSKEERDLLKKNVLWMGIAPAEPLAKNFARDSYSGYSTADIVTGPVGRMFEMAQKHLPEEEKMYNIEFVKCTLKEDFIFTPAHGIMSPTHQKILEDRMNKWKDKYGEYKNNR